MRWFSSRKRKMSNATKERERQREVVIHTHGTIIVGGGIGEYLTGLHCAVAGCSPLLIEFASTFDTSSKSLGIREECIANGVLIHTLQSPKDLHVTVQRTAIEVIGPNGDIHRTTSMVLSNSEIPSGVLDSIRSTSLNDNLRVSNKGSVTVVGCSRSWLHEEMLLGMLVSKRLLLATREANVTFQPSFSRHPSSTSSGASSVVDNHTLKQTWSNGKDHRSLLERSDSQGSVASLDRIPKLVCTPVTTRVSSTTTCSVSTRGGGGKCR